VKKSTKNSTGNLNSKLVARPKTMQVALNAIELDLNVIEALSNTAVKTHRFENKKSVVKNLNERKKVIETLYLEKTKGLKNVG